MSNNTAAAARTAAAKAKGLAAAAEKAEQPTEAKATPKAKRTPKAAPKVQRKDAALFEGKDFTYLADKEPTDLHVSYAAWIQEQTGVAVDVKTVQLAAVLRMAFQASERNQEDLERRRAEAAAKQSAKAAAKEAKEREEYERLQAKFAAAAK